MRYRIAVGVFLAVVTAVLLATGAAASSSTKKVNVVDFKFTPKKLTIKKGQKITWVWASSDQAAHNVTLIKFPKGANQNHFSSQTMGAGSRFTRKFTIPGTYHFICTIHLEMKFTLIVKK
jgi:plastocyanin